MIAVCSRTSRLFLLGAAVSVLAGLSLPQYALAANHQIVPPRFQRRVAYYPDVAREQDLVGTVIVCLDIATKGHVQESAVCKSSGYSVLDEASLTSARESIYAPGTVDGVAVSMLFKATYVYDTRWRTGIAPWSFTNPFSSANLSSPIPSSSPTTGAAATLRERAAMSQSVADYVHDPGMGVYHTNPFKTNSVEIGAAVVETSSDPLSYSRFALADWRSQDASSHGQVFFRYLCDHWNVTSVSIGRPLTFQEILAARTPKTVAENLVAGLAGLESQQVAYLEPAVPGLSC